MKTLTSTDFRKEYAALEEPTEVTVLGRLIGTWFPVGSRYAPISSAVDSRYTDAIRPGEPLAGGFHTRLPYNTEPVRPAPKKGKK